MKIIRRFPHESKSGVIGFYMSAVLMSKIPGTRSCMSFFPLSFNEFPQVRVAFRVQPSVIMAAALLIRSACPQNEWSQAYSIHEGTLCEIPSTRLNLYHQQSNAQRCSAPDDRATIRCMLIVQYLPAHRVRRLYSVNRALFDIGFAI